VNQPSLNTLSLERTSGGAVLTVVLNRPETRNAMSAEMVRELLAVLAHAQAEGVRIIVLRGAGGHFCAGADLKDMAMARLSQQGQDGPDRLAAMNAAFGKMCLAYATAPLAVIAVLEGTVMGGGFGLACVADVAIASETVDFRLPETSLGVVPAQIAPFLLERVGYSEAKRLSVTAARFGAEEAYRIGLVHAVCRGEGELQAALVKSIQQILACAPSAVAETKMLLRRAFLTSSDNLIEEAAAIFAKSARGPEGMEGMQAFIEKRKPAWAIFPA
jgi:isohexenylglutaconyl-CoA hydratase